MTYSVVARDKKTGEMGVAVQSHYFSVGSIVTWARAGVGAVATQAFSDVKYGPLGLELMAAGKTAPEALTSLLTSDDKAEMRQVAMIDSKGRVAGHTGGKCIPYAGHVIGDQFSCQGNLMKNERVWLDMRDAFARNSDLPLPERLVSALEAGEAAGGDARGKQSSAILVVSPEVTANSWSGVVVELRVEDNPEPVVELKRLLRYQRGYDWIGKGDDLISARKYNEAVEAYSRGMDLVPEVSELKYWVGISLVATAEERQRGVAMLRELLAREPNWKQITKGIVAVRMLPIDEKTLGELTS